jgi:2-polyprenyl-3-methyl-5-hydroxy-6-metoxy-1,4-benzoquinol methylase
MNQPIYSKPPHIPDISDCYFYHTTDIPDHGTVEGEWDLRGGEAAYLGNVDFNGKTVLEIGPASGHLTFYMEREGAEVLSYDLSENQEWDTVPYAQHDFEQEIAKRKAHIRRLNNSFWFLHNKYKSKVRVVYGTVYELPEEIGEFDICTLGSVLIHLRDPFLGLQRVASHARNTIIIADVSLDATIKKELSNRTPQRPMVYFVPDASKGMPVDSWWGLSTDALIEFLKILGFKYIELSYHMQKYKGKEYQLYTIAGHRHQA